MLEELKVEYATIAEDKKLLWLYNKDDELARLWEVNPDMEILEATDRVFKEILKLK